MFFYSWRNWTSQRKPVQGVYLGLSLGSNSTHCKFAPVKSSKIETSRCLNVDDTVSVKC